MEKPSLKLSMIQVTPTLQNPSKLSKEIEESIKFIEDHPNVSPQDIPDEMLNRLQIPVDKLQAVTDCLAESEDLSQNPNMVSSLIIFCHLYFRHYRLEDFADFANFITTYERFQILLDSVKRVLKVNETISDDPVNVFDLENIDSAIDILKKSTY